MIAILVLIISLNAIRCEDNFCSLIKPNDHFDGIHVFHSFKGNNNKYLLYTKDNEWDLSIEWSSCGVQVKRTSHKPLPHALKSTTNRFGVYDPQGKGYDCGVKYQEQHEDKIEILCSNLGVDVNSQFDRNAIIFKASPDKTNNWLIVFRQTGRKFWCYNPIDKKLIEGEGECRTGGVTVPDNVVPKDKWSSETITAIVDFEDRQWKGYVVFFTKDNKAYYCFQPSVGAYSCDTKRMPLFAECFQDKDDTTDHTFLIIIIIVLVVIAIVVIICCLFNRKNVWAFVRALYRNANVDPVRAPTPDPQSTTGAQRSTHSLKPISSGTSAPAKQPTPTPSPQPSPKLSVEAIGKKSDLEATSGTNGEYIWHLIHQDESDRQLVMTRAFEKLFRRTNRKDLTYRQKKKFIIDFTNATEKALDVMARKREKSKDMDDKKFTKKFLNRYNGDPGFTNMRLAAIALSLEARAAGPYKEYYAKCKDDQGREVCEFSWGGSGPVRALIEQSPPKLNGPDEGSDGGASGGGGGGGADTSRDK